MFNTYVRGPSHTTATVHEHRAPTDDSLRLLREMEEKIEKKYLNSLNLKDNIIEVELCRSTDMYGTFIHLFFKINGKPVRASANLEYNTESAAALAVNELSKILAVEMMMQLPNEAQRVLFQ